VFILCFVMGDFEYEYYVGRFKDIDLKLTSVVWNKFQVFCVYLLHYG
jgi:hypothetical protein